MYSKVTIVMAMAVANGMDLAGLMASSPATAIPENQQYVNKCSFVTL